MSLSFGRLQAGIARSTSAARWLPNLVVKTHQVPADARPPISLDVVDAPGGARRRSEKPPAAGTGGQGRSGLLRVAERWPRPAGPSPTTLKARWTRGQPCLAAPAVPNRAHEKPPVMGYRGTLEGGQAFTVPTTLLSAQPAGSLESKTPGLTGGGVWPTVGMKDLSQEKGRGVRMPPGLFLRRPACGRHSEKTPVQR